MRQVDPVPLQKVVNAVLAALSRNGRLPTRLDEEDFDDLRQEGLIAAMVSYSKYDSMRGSLGAYLAQPISRAILREAWKIAKMGITGDIASVQVRSDEESMRELNSLTVPDVADEIEAIDTIWHNFYIKTKANRQH